MEVLETFWCSRTENIRPCVPASTLRRIRGGDTATVTLGSASFKLWKPRAPFRHDSQIAFTGLPTPVDNCHVLRISALTRCNRHGKMYAHLNVAPTSAVAQAFKPYHLVAPLLHLRCLPSPPFEPAKTCVCCSEPTFFREVRGRQAGGPSQSAVASRRGRGRTLRGHLRWRGPQVSLSHASGAPSLRSCAPYCPSQLSCLVSELWDNINISDTEICRPASLVARLCLCQYQSLYVERRRKLCSI